MMKFCRYETHILARRGFTLIELLVTVAIISALLALVSSVSMKAYESTLKGRCVGNLRTIGAALQSYIADSNGILPPMSAMEDPFDPGNKNVLVAQKVLMPYTGIDTSQSLPTDDNAVRAYGPWICPSDRIVRDKTPPKSPRWKCYNSYYVNSYVGKGVVNESGADSDSRTVVRGVQIRNPNTIWYMADGFRKDGGQGRMTANMVSAADVSGTGDTLRYRHGETINVLKVSGSVESFTPEQVRDKGNEYTIPAKN
jgi:prepilin-type N-terminal cleavage/methylation domain-containing protein